MLARILKTLFAALLYYAVFTAHANGISISTRVENISYDLGFMQLALEKIGSDMRLSTSTEGALTIENIHAQRLVITKTKDNSSSGSSNGLPDRIRLPLAIHVQSASVSEVVIIDGESTQILNDVEVQLRADDRRLQLNILNATTFWGQLRGDLTLENHRPFALKGNLGLQQLNEDNPYDVQLSLSGDLQHLIFQSSAQLTKSNGITALLHPNSALMNGTILGQIDIEGQLGLDDSLPLTLDASLRIMEETHADRENRLHTQLSLKGVLAPQTDLWIQLESPGSLWQGSPVQLQGSARLLGQIIEDISLNAEYSGNQLRANGSLGSPASVLAWQAELADLSNLDTSINGRLHAEGEIKGVFGQLASSFTWLGEAISIKESVTIKRLSGEAEIQLASGSPTVFDMSAEDLRLHDGMPTDAHLKISGTREMHRIKLNSESTADQSPLLHAIATGSFNANNVWSAQLEKLSHVGNSPIEMQGKAKLQYSSSDGFAMKDLLLKLGGGQLQIDAFQLGDGILTSHGKLNNINIASLPEVFRILPANMSGNPVFSGYWNIEASDTANGQAEFNLVSGDINVLTNDGDTHQLGLDTVNAKLSLHQNHIQLNANANGSLLGEMHLSLLTQLESTESGFMLHRSAPLEIQANARLRSLIWLPFSRSIAGTELDGHIDLQLNGQGTISTPDLKGSLQGRQLRLSILSGGVDLQDGTLDATFHSDGLEVTKARFSGGNGFITASGHMSLNDGEPELKLKWHAEEFTAVLRTDSEIVIAGDLDTHLLGKEMTISGSIEAIRGLIELGADDKPVLGDDIVIIGAPEEIESHPLAIQANNLKIGTGNQFTLRGRGLDSTLNGSVVLNGFIGNNLRAEGTINAAGTYMAYGQVLNIERGRMIFNGQVDNPGLDILALRQNLAVRAGVEIRGTALNPAVKLVSVPEVSDSDKLAWLVFGHGMDRVGQDQFAMLSLAAGALLSQGQSVPLQTRFARAAGLDSFNVSGADPETASVSLGKRLAPNLYLSYEKEITGLLNVARLTYDLTSNWSIRTQAGSESAVDVLYTFSFK